MNSNPCAREPEVVAALLNGALPHDLQAHAHACEVCSEVVKVAGALLNELSPSAELRPPDASVVWRRAQSAAREQAIAKATQPIRIVRISTVVAAAVALPWLALGSPKFASWIPDFTRHIGTVDQSLSSAATGTILLGAIGSVLLVTLSSWYMLRHQ
jgi:hypothetical protein